MRARHVDARASAPACRDVRVVHRSARFARRAMFARSALNFLRRDADSERCAKSTTLQRVSFTVTDAGAALLDVAR